MEAPPGNVSQQTTEQEEECPEISQTIVGTSSEIGSGRVVILRVEGMVSGSILEQKRAQQLERFEEELIVPNR